MKYIWGSILGLLVSTTAYGATTAPAKRAVAPRPVPPKPAAQANREVPAFVEAPVPPKPAAQANREVPAFVTAQQNLLRQRPYGGKFKLSELISVRIENGRPMAELRDSARKAAGERRIEIEGMGGEWKLMYSALGGQAEYIMLTRYDFDEAAKGGLWSVAMYIHTASGVSFIAQGGAGDKSITLGSTAAGLSLTVHDRNAGVAANNVRATSLEELRAQCPKEMRQYVRPVFQRLLGQDLMGAKPANAYRAFTHILPDEKTRSELNRILVELDAPSAEQRDQASVALAKLGPRGVLAILRLDRDTLTIEQQARVDAFVLRHDDPKGAAPEKALADPAFLVACLEFDDPAVRQSAKETLSRLLEKPVDFDLNAPAEARAAAADRIWNAIFVAATTRPAVEVPEKGPVRLGPIN